MNIQLSDHFTYSRLMRFVFPSVMMMIFTSIYGVVDGLFISNYIGKTPFAAVNLIMPFLMLLGGVGFMIGTGGSALVAKTLGEGEAEKANQYFSLLIWFSLVLGIVIAIPGIVFIEPISAALGADDAMMQYCRVYGVILLAAECIPELSDCGRKADAGLYHHSSGRGDQYGTGCPADCSHSHGRCGGGTGNGT